MGKELELKFWPNTSLEANTYDTIITDYLPIEEIVDDMFYTMYATRGIGLSANQVGLIMPILVMDTTSIEGGTLCKEFVNPRIVEHSEETSMQREGCLSFPGVFVNVKRFDSVVVEAEHKNGETFTVVADGIDAVCLQHEIDHLHGITFYDRLSPTAKRVHAAKFKKLKKWKRKNNLE